MGGELTTLFLRDNVGSASVPASAPESIIDVRNSFSRFSAAISAVWRYADLGGLTAARLYLEPAITGRVTIVEFEGGAAIGLTRGSNWTELLFEVGGEIFGDKEITGDLLGDLLEEGERSVGEGDKTDGMDIIPGVESTIGISIGVKESTVIVVNSEVLLSSASSVDRLRGGRVLCRSFRLDCGVHVLRLSSFFGTRVFLVLSLESMNPGEERRGDSPCWPPNWITCTPFGPWSCPPPWLRERT